MKWAHQITGGSDSWCRPLTQTWLSDHLCDHLQNFKEPESLRFHIFPSCFIYQFSCSVRSDSLWPHGLHHARLPCPSPTPGAYSDSCLSSQWCHPTISSSFIPFSCLQSLPASGSFLMSQFFIRWSKYCSFSISPFNEYSGLISFGIDWFELKTIFFSRKKGKLTNVRKILRYVSCKLRQSLW